MAHKGQLFGKGNVRLFNSLQSDEHWGADIDERCRSYRQKLFCWQENVRNSWRMSTSISCMLTHSLWSSFVSGSFQLLEARMQGPMCFPPFLFHLCEKAGERTISAGCAGGRRQGGGRGMTEQGKSFDAGEAPQKNRRSAAKNWVSRVALYVGSHVETWDWAGPLNLHNEAQEQSGPYPW